MVQRLLFAIGLCLLLLTFATADDQSTGQKKADSKSKSHSASAMKQMDHVLLTSDQLQWTEAPPGLPPGAQVAVLEGDPNKGGLFTMRAKMPAGYRIPPHIHPADEHVTVIEGSLQMGMGDKFDEASMTNLPAGGFAMMKKGTHHFAMTRDGATIQIHGQGPWGITYLNKSDDPRTLQSAK